MQQPLSNRKGLLTVMEIALFLLKKTLSVAINALSIAMFVRAILSWLIDPMNEGRFSTFLYMLTEPVIMPMRALCAKMHWFEGMPMDMPYLLTFLCLTLLDILVTLI